jgi:hypothetical protein
LLAIHHQRESIEALLNDHLHWLQQKFVVLSITMNFCLLGKNSGALKLGQSTLSTFNTFYLNVPERTTFEAEAGRCTYLGTFETGTCAYLGLL